MIGITKWNHTPFTLCTDPTIKQELFITQILPHVDGFTVKYRDIDGDCHMLCYRERGEQTWQESAEFTVKGLPCDRLYEVAVKRKSGEMTAARLVYTYEPIGTIVNYLHPEDPAYISSGKYLCSPGICVLPSGKLLASMDIFDHKAAQNLTLIFESNDKGLSWDYVTELRPCFWGKLFVHRERLYMLGMSCEYGDLLIGSSDDEGRTWTPPVRLFSGTNAGEIGWHKAPMPIIKHEGMLYTAIDYGAWKYGGHANSIASCASDADLLDPRNWHMTTPLPFDDGVAGMPQGKLAGLLEGNAIVAPDGSIVNMLRLQQYAATPNVGNAVILRMVDRDKPLVQDRVIRFPLGASSKFVVLKMRNTYVAVGNEWHDTAQPAARNLLSVAISFDLENWQVVERVVDKSAEDCRKIAFQYPDMALVGDDLIILSRTAYGGAASFHDTNSITCHRVSNFIQYIK